jgi:hypothetical protein
MVQFTAAEVHRRGFHPTNVSIDADKKDLLRRERLLDEAATSLEHLRQKGTSICALTRNLCFTSCAIEDMRCTRSARMPQRRRAYGAIRISRLFLATQHCYLSLPLLPLYFIGGSLATLALHS